MTGMKGEMLREERTRDERRLGDYHNQTHPSHFQLDMQKQFGGGGGGDEGY